MEWASSVTSTTFSKITITSARLQASVEPPLTNSTIAKNALILRTKSFTNTTGSTTMLTNGWKVSHWWFFHFHYDKLSKLTFYPKCTAAFDGKATTFDNGNADFSIYGFDGKKGKFWLHNELQENQLCPNSVKIFRGNQEGNRLHAYLDVRDPWDGRCTRRL